MRKIILFNMVTVDGFFEGIDHSIEWHHVDEEFNEFAVEQLNSAGMLLFGRKTYDLMAGYWPSEIGFEDDPVVANKMNTISKIVFSKSLKKAEWQNTKVFNEVSFEVISTLKHQQGKDLFILGSSELASTFTEMNLIDEYRIMINPVVIGQGKPLFANIHHILELRLIKSRIFKSGNVLLNYEIKRN
jgi:dihydrofolate reductase